MWKTFLCFLPFTITIISLGWLEYYVELTGMPWSFIYLHAAAIFASLAWAWDKTDQVEGDVDEDA